MKATWSSKWQIILNTPLLYFALDIEAQGVVNAESNQAMFINIAKYHKFASRGFRNLTEYNPLILRPWLDGENLPWIPFNGEKNLTFNT